MVLCATVLITAKTFGRGIIDYNQACSDLTSPVCSTKSKKAPMLIGAFCFYVALEINLHFCLKRYFDNQSNIAIMSISEITFCCDRISVGG